MANTPSQGPRGDASGPSPILSPEDRRKVTRRLDRLYGITLFVLGVFGTIMHMLALTENAIAAQAALMFEQYQVGAYVRPEGLNVIAWTGILLHPLNYALWLWLALVRWKREKLAAWCAIVGAIIAWLLSSLLVAVGLMLHPQLTDALMQQAGIGG